MDRDAALARVERELDRIGLLLQHDRELPSATTLAAGAPIAGSWWGHALGHDLYDVLSRLERGAGKLSVKLVDGKVTYVHARLWLALLALVDAEKDRLTHGLSASARTLLELVSQRGSCRSDELCKAGFGTSKQVTAAARELELRLLVHIASLHTDSGAHTKVLQSWDRFASAQTLAHARPSPDEARGQLRDAVTRLGQATRRSLRVILLTAQT